MSGIFFRSVEFRWVHPDDVVSGAGTVKLGGRFASAGTRAVYASDSEETLLREIGARKRRLGGNALMDVGRYPRVVFRIDIKVGRHVSFARPFRDRSLEAVRRQCLSADKLDFSQSAGDHWRAAGVQAVRYASVTGRGVNVVVFLENTTPGEVAIFNREELMERMARLGGIQASW